MGLKGPISRQNKELTVFLFKKTKGPAFFCLKCTFVPLSGRVCPQMFFLFGVFFVIFSNWATEPILFLFFESRNHEQAKRNISPLFSTDWHPPPNEKFCFLFLCNSQNCSGFFPWPITNATEAKSSYFLTKIDTWNKCFKCISVFQARFCPVQSPF